MRFILSLMLLSALAILVACQSSAAPTSIEPIAINTPQPAKPTAPPSDGHNHAADEEAPRIALADAKKAFDESKALFIDTRFADAYKLEHVKGAINIPANEIETRYKDVPKGKMIIAYCSWASEHTSAGLVAKLKEKGYENAFALVGGTSAWKEAGYPMEKGK